MTGVLPANAKRTNKGRFCRAKTFIRNNNAGDRLTASWSAIEKQETEKKKNEKQKTVYFHAPPCRNIVSRSCFFGNKIIRTF